MSKAKVKTTRWDVVDYLKTEEDRVAYLEACFEEAGDDAAFIAKALGDVARSYGMAQVARETGLGRESLYKALSADGNPEFSTVLKVLKALGIRLQAAPAERAGKKRRARAA
jgi:probable addiction module antidote protein